MADQADQNIFGSGTPQNNTGSDGTLPNADSTALATMLAEIKNERGEPKYKNVQEALKALGHAQQFIPDLKTEKDRLELELQEARSKLTRMDELERTVQELTQRKPNESADKPPSGITPEQIAELVRNTLAGEQTKAAQERNIESVRNAVVAKFGDKAQETFYGKAKELGISVADFNAMAAKSPTAVLKLIGADGSQTETRQPASYNTDGFQPRQDSFVGRSKRSALTGSTSQDLREELEASGKMVKELHDQGLEVSDLTNPKVYFKQFGAR